MVIPAQRAASMKPAVRRVRSASTEALKERGTRNAAAKNRFAAWQKANRNSFPVRIHQPARLPRLAQRKFKWPSGDHPSWTESIVKMEATIFRVLFSSNCWRLVPWLFFLTKKTHVRNNVRGCNHERIVVCTSFLVCFSFCCFRN